VLVLLQGRGVAVDRVWQELESREEKERKG